MISNSLQENKAVEQHLLGTERGKAVKLDFYIWGKYHWKAKLR